MNDLIERLKAILLNPKTSWAGMRAEETTINKIYNEYFALLALIPSIAGFFGSIFKGNNFFRSLVWGTFYYVLSLVGVWCVVKIIEFLAKNFKLELDDLTIYKLVAHTYTPIFVAGVFFLIPPLSWLSISGLYGFYLFILGVTDLLTSNREEQFNFTIISLLSIVMVLIFVFVISELISGVNVTYLKIQ